ncbi:MAG: hypothetical protein B7Z72_02700 [Gemmatimonadetes bacterium 21-71-4]|nr:MAG: hypothetical protein B7Z72_02700 [Gemmatimonadetes bacterium 21-71-4]
MHRAILDATRELLTTGSYAELSMESVAARAQVGKKTLYRRWSSKAPLVAEAVLDAYGGSGSFPVAATGDVRADLRSWLNEHAEFLAEPANTALVRALVAAAAARPGDGEDLYTEVLVTYPQLVLGADIMVPTVAASVSLRVPAGTQSGQVFHLRGRGLPRVNAGGTGDLHVRVQLWTPDRLTEDEERIIRELGTVQQSVPMGSREKGFWKKMKEALGA